MIGRRETLRLAPKSFVFGLFEATFDQNNLSHADFATRGDSDAFARSSHMVYAFDGSQPAASAHRRTAATRAARRRRRRRAARAHLKNTRDAATSTAPGPAREVNRRIRRP